MKKLSAMLLLAGVFLAGCGNASSTGNSSANSKQVQIVAVGSTALQPLVESAQEQFVAKNANYQITVQGGGSGTGLSQVASGSVQIGNSDVFAEEKDGVDASKLVDHQVAVVGMAPVVNKAVGVKNVTKDQLIAIFTGKVKNWQELGGKDQEIVVVNRASGSGTRATFEKWGLDGAKTIQAQEQDSSGTVKKIVSSTPGAISYLALSYIDDSLEALSLDGVAPTAENIETNDWPIWSYEHMYTKGKPTKEIKKFLDYMVSDEVQEGLVKELGYLPVTKMQVSRSADGQVTEK
ncbi:phosphate ABC transporter substrate-binding protein PstS family protein [Enterococcus cecorum]|uniref:phosphate ABC transporter substrate-binding protein PstS family protein n=1 Tax=Enterococcus cecorum TaxID=44008 RepID=UPI000AB85F0A|nr:phosphate ABC transporter substrate-binding protein PstS family protein [Enterococcus cecorum]MCJ0552150.1 phosphate ABC transporter substrate-binding protein PstS family protein [Enterococcus cecorum]MCJ0557157.1 phosphate ABC transporter substrate-binding protein PstS family protein [Enterococcus cecorum]MCJ0561857.1 phosphate ABC transporter substrate-binding protein PstS family protein [Enterococcus cecorum]MCJ0564457.1 phosphate ABC transporter substrate-binding protein PstS family prot